MHKGELYFYEAAKTSKLLRRSVCRMVTKPLKGDCFQRGCGKVEVVLQKQPICILAVRGAIPVNPVTT